MAANPDTPAAPPYDIGSLLAQARMTSDIEWSKSSTIELRTDVRELRGDLRLCAKESTVIDLNKKVDRLRSG